MALLTLESGSSSGDIPVNGNTVLNIKVSSGCAFVYLKTLYEIYTIPNTIEPMHGFVEESIKGWAFIEIRGENLGITEVDYTLS